jgi:hypothetical protein
MTDNTEPRTATIWRHSEWRCEYWDTDASASVRLYMGQELVQSHTTRDAFDALAQSETWRQAVRGASEQYWHETSLLEQADRRVQERRRVARGGRRNGEKQRRES